MWLTVCSCFCCCCHCCCCRSGLLFAACFLLLSGCLRGCCFPACVRGGGAAGRGHAACAGRLRRSAKHAAGRAGRGAKRAGRAAQQVWLCAPEPRIGPVRVHQWCCAQSPCLYAPATRAVYMPWIDLACVVRQVCGVWGDFRCPVWVVWVDAPELTR